MLSFLLRKWSLIYSKPKYLFQIQLINPVVEGRPATADVVKGKEHAPVLQLASNNSLQNRVCFLKILFFFI